MPKRLLIILFIITIAVLFILGFLVNYFFTYAALFLLMISMHLFGHGHHGGGRGRDHGGSEKDEGDHH